jgi:hypothetical protein
MRQYFAQLRHAIMRVLLLADFKPAWPTPLEMDASAFAIVGINLQQQDDICSGTEGAAWHVRGGSAGKGP